MGRETSGAADGAPLPAVDAIARPAATEALGAGRVYVGAYAVCVAQGRLLLARMSPTAPDAGQWTLPGGGLHWGESPEEGVLRELEEETGLSGTIAGVAGVFSATYHRSADRPAPSVHHLGIIYFVESLEGDLRDEAQGTTDRCAWVPVPDLDDLALVPLARRGRDLLRAAESGSGGSPT